MTTTSTIARLFGTDGVRGLANADLTPELAMALGAAAARVLAGTDPIGRTAVVGRDPRASGEMLTAAVTAGVNSAGVGVLDVGVLPTPAVAHLVGSLGAAFGVMISASHNPMPDNGVKLFATGGHKLPDLVEDRIERELGAQVVRPTGAAIGRRFVHDGTEEYLHHLTSASPTLLGGLRVVVDCANGAASRVAPLAYRRAGAEVVVLHAEPDGLNINDNCGSTYPADLRAAVVEHGADLGIAHDGDADRCLAVDADGRLVDGDRIMAILAVAMRDAGELEDDTLVTTVMSNLGLHLAMEREGIAVRTTGVGDRYLLAELQAGGFSLGGEQSGHLVMPRHGTTGDGVLTALRLMARMVQTESSLAGLGALVQPLPQVLINVRVHDRSAAHDPVVLDAVARAEAQLAGAGRVLLRPSGTEPLVRVMVEAPTADSAQQLAQQLARLVAAV